MGYLAADEILDKLGHQEFHSWNPASWLETRQFKKFSRPFPFKNSEINYLVSCSCHQLAPARLLGVAYFLLGGDRPRVKTRIAEVLVDQGKQGRFTPDRENTRRCTP
jgi:hypothetical protein